MKSEEQSPSARTFVDALAASGRHHFTSSEVRAALGVSAQATRMAMHRLLQQDVVASPARGFYVIIPPEYRSVGCLPADHFIPELMDFVGARYYVGLLSAAQFHGAAHHRPQEFQVVLEKTRRPIACGRVRIAFVQRRNASRIPVQQFNTPRGFIAVSTPEATALDLVGYHDRSGGLDNVASVLTDLAEKIDPAKLVASAKLSPIAWSQRLGFLMDLVDAGSQARELKSFVSKNAREYTGLLPGSTESVTSRDDVWKVDVNTEIEVDS